MSWVEYSPEEPPTDGRTSETTAFALLVFLPETSDRHNVMLDGEAESSVNAPTDILHLNGDGTWPTWIGTLDWERLMDRRRLVLARAPDAQARVSNSDTKNRLVAKMKTARLAALLVAPGTATGPGWVLAGNMSSNSASTTYIEPLVKVFEPFFSTILEYRHGDFERRRASTLGFDGTPDLDLAVWTQVYGIIEGLRHTRRMPRPLEFALVAYESAAERRWIDFRIPDLVRTAECILAQGKQDLGKAEFARRALRLLPSLGDDWYAGGYAPGLEYDLRDLYDRRNGCVHGKLPFDDLQAMGDSGRAIAARLERLATELARRSLLFALRHVDDAERRGDNTVYDLLNSRPLLEEAWRSGTFPPRG